MVSILSQNTNLARALSLSLSLFFSLGGEGAGRAAHEPAGGVVRWRIPALRGGARASLNLVVRRFASTTARLTDAEDRRPVVVPPSNSGVSLFCSFLLFLSETRKNGRVCLF